MSLITVDQLAKELKVSHSQIYRMAAARQLPHYRVGAQIRFSLDEVLEALKARTEDQR